MLWGVGWHFVTNVWGQHIKGGMGEDGTDEFFHLVLDAFVNVWKATISFFMSVRPQGMTQLPIDGYSWILIFEYFSKICRENSITSKSDKNDSLRDGQYTHFIVSRSFLCGMRNVSNRSCKESQNAFYVQ
jgi:hypothetical protein